MRGLERKGYLARIAIPNERQSGAFYKLTKRGRAAASRLPLFGELFPREVVTIEGFDDVIEQMSDLISIGAMFAMLIVGLFASLISLRKALTRALSQRYGASGDAALELLGAPVVLSGHATVDAERLKSSLDAHSTVLRAITYQREIDQLGGRAMRTVMAKAAPALGAIIKKLAKMQIGAP